MNRAAFQIKHSGSRLHHYTLWIQYPVFAFVDSPDTWWMHFQYCRKSSSSHGWQSIALGLQFLLKIPGISYCHRMFVFALVCQILSRGWLFFPDIWLLPLYVPAPDLSLTVCFYPESIMIAGILPEEAYYLPRVTIMK